jgi:hypothetical protein
MVYFHTQNPHLGTFWRALECEMLIYLTAVPSIHLPFCIFDDNFGIFWGHLVYFLLFWFENLATLVLRIRDVAAYGIMD